MELSLQKLGSWGIKRVPPQKNGGGKFIASALLLFFVVTNASADTVSIFGVPFTVDEIHEIDSSQVELVLHGKSILVGKKDLYPFIIQQKIINEEFLFSSQEEGERFLKGLQEAPLNDWEELLQPILRIYLLSLKELGAHEKHFLSKLLKKHFFDEAVKDLIIQRVGFQSEIQSWLIHLEILRDPQWVQSHVVQVVYSLGDTLKNLCLEEYFARISERNFTEAQILLDAYATFFPSEKALYSELSGVASRVNASLDKNEKSFEALELLLQRLPEAAGVRSRLAPTVSELVTRELKKLTEARECNQGLQFLSLVPPEFQTLQFHEQVVRLLQRCNEGVVSIPQQSMETLVRLAQADPFIRDEFSHLVEKEIVALAEAGEGDAAESKAQSLLRVPAAHPKSVGKILLTLSSLSIHNGLYSKARSFLKQIPDDAPLSVKLKKSVQWLSTYIPLPLFFLLLGLFCATVVLRRVKWLKKAVDVKDAQETSPRFESEEFRAPGMEENDLPPFVNPQARMSSSFKLTPEEKEYVATLKKFGLSPTASEHEIKARYRLLMKSFHPDSRPANATIASDDFLETKELYDKLLELRKKVRDFSKLE